MTPNFLNSLGGHRHSHELLLVCSIYYYFHVKLFYRIVSYLYFDISFSNHSLETSNSARHTHYAARSTLCTVGLHSQSENRKLTDFICRRICWQWRRRRSYQTCAINECIFHELKTAEVGHVHIIKLFWLTNY